MKKNSSAGFTLLELLFVIMLILILAAVNYPLFRNNLQGLQLSSFSKKLQVLFIYLRDQSIVERKAIYLVIDVENKKYWSEIIGEDGQDVVLKRYIVPERIEIETKNNKIAFYPDGTIDGVDSKGETDKVVIKLSSSDNQNVTLTTKGVYGGVKLEIP